VAEGPPALLLDELNADLFAKSPNDATLTGLKLASLNQERELIGHHIGTVQAGAISRDVRDQTPSASGVCAVCRAAIPACSNCPAPFLRSHLCSSKRFHVSMIAPFS
jgi:hypothetical protein